MHDDRRHRGNRVSAHRLAAVRLIALASAAAATGAAAQAYPVKPVRIVITFSPGTAGDTLLRLISRRLPDALGQQSVIDNRVGANGLIGTGAAQRAAADGYTLLFTNDAFLINPLLFKKPPYDPIADFAPVTIVATIPYVLAVHPSLPVQSVKALIALARTRPGEINYASGGLPQRLAMQLFAGSTGIALTNVNYKGTGPAFSDVLGGHVPMMFAGVTNALPHATSGRLKLLAVSGAARSRALPNVPTMAEAGVAGYQYAVWLGYLAPHGTPPEIVARLHTEITRVVRLAEVQREFAEQGFEPLANSPEEFAGFMQKDRVRLAKLIRDAGIPIEQEPGR
jgi:tripartite-type tricarboxylate transporter receptor subunit TctC